MKLPPAEPFLVGNSPAIQQLRKDVARISEYDLAVLVCGDTGTGKGVVAQNLHNNSPRAGHKFLTINCANLPVNLMESELFGYKRGAFTGACSDKPGRFELAQEGTIFLDEISDMSTYMQAKLLHVLQEKEFCPVGGVNSVHIQARIVSATNTDLKKAISQGAFREDLYYRLAVIRLEMPALKDRREDIPVLVNHYLDKYSLMYKKSVVPNLSDNFWDFLMAYDWPGNVRELESSMRSVVALENEETVREEMCRKLGMIPARGYSGEICAQRIPDRTLNLNKESSLHDLSLPEIVDHTVSRIEAMLIRKALEQTGVKKKAAQILGISYKSLLNKIKSYGL
ncbi:MAG: sigma-54 interaction domain-containing protein [Desulfobia sp.]